MKGDLRNSLITINDQVGFLNFLDEIVEADRVALLRFLVKNSNQNLNVTVDNFSYAKHNYDDQREEEVGKILAKYWCAEISAGSFERTSEII